MDLKRLRYYCAIVDYGQISKAAEALHIAQPALSQRLKELEEVVGATLIIRKAQHWQMTEAGQLLYSRAKNMIRSYDDLVAEFQDFVYPYDSMMTIGVSSICFSYLAKVIVEMQKQYPQIHFRILSGDIAYLEGLIAAKKIDFAIYHNPTQNSELNCVKLVPSTYSLLYAKGTFPHQPVCKLRDLKNVPIIVPRRSIGGDGYQWLLNRLQEDLGYNPIIIDSPDVHTLSLLLDYGLQAAAIFPTSEIHAYRYMHYDSSVIDEPDFLIQPYLVHYRDQYLSQAARLVMDNILCN